MTIPTTAISETTPAGDSNIALGDNRIREYKVQNREILEVDHNYPSSGQDADAGKHKKVSLIEQADLGTGAAGLPILGAQTVGGKAELVFTDEDNNDIQITDNGGIKFSSINDVPNNTYFKSVDNAGTGTVDLIKANASDVPVIPDGTETATNAAPVSDNDVSNKKYVDDQVDTVTLNSIEDYGTSTTTGTSKNQSDLKICYGRVTVAGSSGQAISNLPFSSSTSYSVFVTYETTSISAEPGVAFRNSGSQFTVYNGSVSSQNIFWVAVGT